MSKAHNISESQNFIEFLSDPIPITEQIWDEKIPPLVSISCITYNHEKYIRDAIEGFIAQKTTFPVEILIHDDASTDNTANIVREYEAKYPQLIKPIYQEENQYSKQDGTIGRIQRGRAIGKYYATCEGDDYWIDTLKLQKQVDFLEANKDYSFSFHKVIVVDENMKILKGYAEPSTTILYFKDIVIKHYIPTCSLVFRMDFLPKNYPPRWMSQVLMGDIPLELFLVDKGPVKYINEEMGVHIKHPGGVTRNKSHIMQGRVSYIRMYKGLRKSLSYKRYPLLTIMIIKHRLGQIKDYLGLNKLLHS